MKKNLILILLLSISGILFYSCDKNEDNQVDYSQQTTLAQNYAFVQGIYSDIFELLCQASDDSALIASGAGLIGGASVIYDSVNDTYTFEFGSIKSTNGKSGSFIADCDGDFKAQGTRTSIAFNNFYVGNSKVEGSNDITNMGKLSKKTNPSLLYTDSVSNAKIISGNDTITFNAGYSVNWFVNDSVNLFDDEYTFGGFVTGYTNTNKSFKADVSPANLIIFTPSCTHIVSGIINMVMHTPNTSNGMDTTAVIVDFIQSDGCNNQIQVSTNGTIVSFPLQ